MSTPTPRPSSPAPHPDATADIIDALAAGLRHQLRHRRTGTATAWLGTAGRLHATHRCGAVSADGRRHGRNGPTDVEPLGTVTIGARELGLLTRMQGAVNTPPMARLAVAVLHLLAGALLIFTADAGSAASLRGWSLLPLLLPGTLLVLAAGALHAGARAYPSPDAARWWLGLDPVGGPGWSRTHRHAMRALAVAHWLALGALLLTLALGALLLTLALPAAVPVWLHLTSAALALALLGAVWTWPDIAAVRWDPGTDVWVAALQELPRAQVQLCSPSHAPAHRADTPTGRVPADRGAHAAPRARA